MGRYRRYKGPMGQVVAALTIGFAAYFLLYLGGAFHRLGIYVYDTSHTAILLAFVLLFTFLNIPAHKGAPRDRLPWYDAILIVLSLAGTLYIFFQAEAIAVGQRGATDVQQILAVITVVAILEAARRAASPILSVLGGLFFLYPMFADKAPGFLERPAWGLARITSVQYLYPSGIFGSTMHMVATLIVAFIIFGAFLQVSGAGAAFINLALSLVGRFRGGPAKVAIVASCLFGSVNGSTLANIATTGSVTIPLMKSCGYKPTFAGAVEAVASSGGPLTPPVMGAMIFLMMDFLGIGYVEIMLVSLAPIVLYYLGLFIMVDHEAVKNGLKGLTPEEIPPLKKTAREAWFCAVPLAVIVYLLVFLHFAPSTAAVAAVVSVVLASVFKRGSRMGLRKLRDALAASSQGLPEVGSAVAVAGLMMGSFNITGIGLTISRELVAIAGGNLVILTIITAIACIIFGMGLSAVAVYLLGAMLFAPALTLMGAKPIAAHLFVVYMAHAAQVTPPVCPGAFLAGAMARAPLMATGWQACRLGIVIYLMPIFWVFDPALLLIGSPTHVALAVVSGIVGVYYLSCGIAGRMLKSAAWLERSLFMVGGALLMMPGNGADLLGLGTVALPTLWQFTRARLVPATLNGR